MQPFSFSKMRQSLGLKGESLRKKIMTTTNEWKVQSGNTSSSSDFFASASEGVRSQNLDLKPADAPFPEPPSPRKHQHEMWAKLMRKKICVVQDFLMSIEAKEEGGEGEVPAGVWEALADLDRVRHELHNYSSNMA